MKESKETQKAVKAAMAQHAKLVIGDGQHRQEQAMREIGEILKKYEVALVPRAMISPGGIEFMIETQAKPPEVVEAEKKAAKEKKDALQKRDKKKKAKKKKTKKR